MWRRTGSRPTPRASKAKQLREGPLNQTCLRSEVNSPRSGSFSLQDQHGESNLEESDHQGAVGRIKRRASVPFSLVLKAYPSACTSTWFPNMKGPAAARQSHLHEPVASLIVGRICRFHLPVPRPQWRLGADQRFGDGPVAPLETNLNKSRNTRLLDLLLPLDATFWWRLVLRDLFHRSRLHPGLKCTDP